MALVISQENVTVYSALTQILLLLQPQFEAWGGKPGKTGDFINDLVAHFQTMRVILVRDTTQHLADYIGEHDVSAENLAKCFRGTSAQVAAERRQCVTLFKDMLSLLPPARL